MARVAVIIISGLLAAACSPTSAVPSGTPASIAPTSSFAPSPTTTPSVAARTDYRDVPGRLLVQHFGNALDGTELDSVNYNSDRVRFYLMNPDGSDLKELLPGKPAGGKNMADISPDGTAVVFQDGWGYNQIHEVRLDGTGFRTISTACDCLRGQPGLFARRHPDRVHPPERGSLFRSASAIWRAATVTMLPETEGEFTDPDSGQGIVPEQPAWSPDGRSIVYSVMDFGKDGYPVASRIKIIDIESRVVTDLSLAADQIFGEPKFSPDGSLILLSSRPGYAMIGQRNGYIYTVHPDGTALNQLTTGEATGANWTPDGRHILFMSGQIWLMDPDGRNAAPWSKTGPSLSSTERGFGYTTYWIPAH